MKFCSECGGKTSKNNAEDFECESCGKIFEMKKKEKGDSGAYGFGGFNTESEGDGMAGMTGGFSLGDDNIMDVGGSGKKKEKKESGYGFENEDVFDNELSKHMKFD